MGYYARSFQEMVQPWLNDGWLKAGHRLIELGAQEFFSDVAETRREVGTFLATHGLQPATIDRVLGKDELPHVRPIYEALGIGYASIDVDGAYGSTFFDLNTFATPPAWRVRLHQQ